MSRNRKFNPSAIILSVALVVLALDQWSKRAVISTFLPGESRLIVPRLVRWTYERNFHGAFGLFGSNGALLIGLAIAVLFVFWLSFRDSAARSRLVCIAFGMIVGGAIGNIIDRVHFGYVVDFIDFYKIWPNIFNVADSCITIGVMLLLLSSLATSRRHA